MISTAKRSKYGELFTLRSDGRYQGYYRDASGKRHAVCDRDPEKLYLKIQQKEAPKTLLFRDLAEFWHDTVWEHYKDGTQSAYNAAYERALAEFGDWEAADLNTADIFAHLERLKGERRSARTVKAQRTLYKLIYQAAMTDKELGTQIKINPAASCPLPKSLPKPQTREAPEDDVVALIRSSAATAYNGLLPLFLMATGFRRGEALGVQWGDVDLKRREISCRQAVSHRTACRIQETKTENAIRTVPILPDLEAVLVRPKDAKDTDFVFCGSDPSKPLAKSTYERRWLHYCREVGFAVDEPETRVSKQGKTYTVHHWKSTLTAHMLRHGYATLLFEADVDEYTAQKLLGHANIETTRRVYTHLRQRKQQKSLDLLRQYVAKEIGQTSA